MAIKSPKDNKDNNELKNLKSGLMLSGGVLIFAAIVIMAMILNKLSASNAPANTGLALVLFIFTPVFLVSLITFVIFAVRFLRLKK